MRQPSIPASRFPLGPGKSGGFQSIILFRQAEKAFLAYCFAKSNRANIRRDELKAFRKPADQMFGHDERASRPR